MTNAEFWAVLRAGLEAEFVGGVYEHQKLPVDAPPCVVIAPDTESGEKTLDEAYNEGTAALSFRVTVVSTEGWAAAMALAPRARGVVEQLEGASFVGLDSADYLVNVEGERPLFAMALRYRADVTAS